MTTEIGDFRMKPENNGWRVWEPAVIGKWWFFVKEEDALDFIDRQNKERGKNTSEQEKQP